MRKHYLLGLGGLLLATTALSSAASAFTVQTFATSGTPNTTSSAAVTVGAQLFGTGGTDASAAGLVGPEGVNFNFTNQYTQSLAPDVYITIGGTAGATFSAASSLSGGAGPGTNAVYLLDYTAAGAVTSALTGASCTVGVIPTQIQLQNCYGVSLGTTGANTNASFLLAGIALSGLVYTAATGLATVGSTISIGASVIQHTNVGNTFETLAATTLVTSANTVSIVQATGAASVAAGTGATPFTSVSQSLGDATAAGGLTVVLAEIDFTGTGVLNPDLLTPTPPASAVGALALTVTSPVLTDPAIANVRFVSKGSDTVYSVATATTGTTTAAFTSSQLTNAKIYAANKGTNYVQVEYNGTTSITGGVAGTLAGVFAANTGGATANPIAAIAGTTSAVNRANFSADANFVQPSANTFVVSYIRLTNTGAASGVVTAVVKNANSGAILGTYTTAALTGGSTIQISAAQIETGASIPSVATTPYNITFSGPITGYLQHVTGNGATGVFTDFSGRRGGVGTGND